MTPQNPTRLYRSILLFLAGLYGIMMSREVQNLLQSGQAGKMLGKHDDASLAVEGR
jgi:hypothetical protein